MQLSNLLNSWPAKVTDNFPWPYKHPGRPYRVWILNENNKLQMVGVMAACISELKQKSMKFFTEKKKEFIDIDCVFVVTMEEGLIINDDDYLRQMSNLKELLLLLPNQEWSEVRQLNINSKHKEKKIEEKSLLSYNSFPSCQNQNVKNDYRYFVPTPEGEIARFTVDVYREKPLEAGCVRLTAATAGDAGMTVSYEIRLNGARTIIHYACRCTAVLLTCVGKLMVETGEMIKNRLY